MILVQAKNLTKHFPVEASRDVVHAVDQVNLAVTQGETLGLVGESGCGKTTVGRLLMRLVDPTSGEIWVDGKNVMEHRGAMLREIRSNMQIIFQNPFASLNPRMTVETIIERPLIIHRRAWNAAKRSQRIDQLLDQVGLRPEHRQRYPHEFSGGQRQRIAIARALSVEPKFLVLDEPTSALDVSVQAQILNLLKRLQQELGISYLFISHDLGAVRHMSRRIAVMYLGQVVEEAPAESLFKQPKHPYTQALISAIPVPDPWVKRERISLRGELPSAIHLPTGCRFHTRCPLAVDRCRTEPPLLREVGAPGESHLASCHFAEPVGER